MSPDLKRAIDQYPPHTQVVMLEQEGQATLRGVFVPAGEGAPVVLHLVGATQSPASILQPLDPATWNLADRGYASLILDYSGIGVSGGEPDVDLLESDVRRMWVEALRRADGKPEQVIVRATSLGTIATALALQSGARPAAVLLVAPVFADTVVERFARDSYGILLGWLATAIYRPVARVDVIDELERSGTPLCVTVFDRDTWATDGQLRALEELSSASSPGTWTELEGDHIGGVAAMTTLDPGELEFLDALEGLHPFVLRSVEDARAELDGDARAALAGAPDADARFGELARRFMLVPPEQLAAAALEHDDLTEAEILIRLLRHVAPRSAPFDALRALYSTAGSPHQAVVSAIAGFSLFGGDMIRRGTMADQHLWAEPLVMAQHVQALSRSDSQVERQLASTTDSTVVTLTWTASPLVDSTTSDEQFRLTLARGALKAAGIPDRVVAGEDGGQRLEYHRKGKWTRLDVQPAAATPAP